jgi:hypothetical protein
MRFFPVLSPTVIALVALLYALMMTSQASAAEFKQTPAELIVSYSTIS